MLSRTLIAVAAAVALALAVPVGAATKPKLSAAQMVECVDGDGARSATFLGRMHALPGTDRMLMRVTLLEQFGDERLHAVDVPELRAWRSAKPGVKVFRYRQTVTALQGGGEYRARLDFRWLDRDGNLLRKSQRTTRACALRGELPNLVAEGPQAQSGPERTAVYLVPVRNDGKAPARDVAVELYVDGAAANVAHIDSLAPGERREVRVAGPLCQRRLRLVVDPADSVKERLESDNVTSVRCPPLAR